MQDGTPGEREGCPNPGEKGEARGGADKGGGVVRVVESGALAICWMSWKHRARVSLAPPKGDPRVSHIVCDPHELSTILSGLLGRARSLGVGVDSALARSAQSPSGSWPPGNQLSVMTSHGALDALLGSR